MRPNEQGESTHLRKEWRQKLVSAKRPRRWAKRPIFAKTLADVKKHKQNIDTALWIPSKQIFDCFFHDEELAKHKNAEDISLTLTNCKSICKTFANWKFNGVDISVSMSINNYNWQTNAKAFFENNFFFSTNASLSHFLNQENQTVCDITDTHKDRPLRIFLLC